MSPTHISRWLAREVDLLQLNSNHLHPILMATKVLALTVYKEECEKQEKERNINS